MQSFDQSDPKPFRLPIINDRLSVDFDIDAELKRFEEQEMLRLGLLGQERKQWTDTMIDPSFKASERSGTTLLISGLTMAQDYFIEGALKGIGYNVRMLDCPDNEALRYGKEFGNRAQCNPTYFTVGNLVKELIKLRDVYGLTPEEIIKKYVFVTAGACGPCRFGMYVTEYRKALRDAGFDGFRVLLFQQTGGLKQATGEEEGLKMDPEFFISIVKAIMAGDVLNALCYRIRPYEIEPGATDRAMEKAKKLIHEALAERRSLILAMLKARRELSRVKVDKLMPKPKVSIIGEFWAMTTEGDGNYSLQKFLESEGAEDDIQLVSAWLLYTIWEARHDTENRATLRGIDEEARKGLKDTNVAQHLLLLKAADKLLRVAFHGFGWLIGLKGYQLPDMDLIAKIAHEHYNNELRGGEGHMEVGKLILNVKKKKATMTVSVKPFGCMPSSGVSDGVQTIVTEKYPDTIFCAVETSGDGATNFYSRVQMFLFKARLAAREELQKALDDTGLTLEEVQDFLRKNPKFASPFFKPDHKVSSTAANMVYHLAPYIKLSRTQRAWENAKAAYAGARELWQKARQNAPAAYAFSKQLYAETKENWPSLRATAQKALGDLTQKMLLSLKERLSSSGKAQKAEARVAA